MVNKVCSQCGSNKLISDRSLGGRLICARCGSSSFKTNNIFNKKNKSFLYLLLLIFILIVIII